jgi:predicted MFS family arabinose efflux permease
VAASVALVSFVVWERRVEEPILPARIFVHREVTLAVVANLVAGIGFFGGIVYLPVFFQSVALHSAFGSGVLLIPFACSTAMGTFAVGQVVERVGRGVRTFPIVGMVSMAAGFALLGLVSARTPVAWVVACGLFVGVGIGFVMQVLLFVVQRATPERDRGTATAATILARITGSVIGVALAANVLNQQLAGGLAARGSPVDPDALQGDADSIRAFAAPIRDQIVESYAAALATTFRVFVPIMVLGLLVAASLPRHVDRDRSNG